MNADPARCEPASLEPGSETPASGSIGLRSLVRFLRAVRERWALLALCIAACWAAGLAYWKFTPRVYQADAEVMIQVVGRDDKLLVSEPVLKEAVRDLMDRGAFDFAGIPEADRTAWIRERLIVRNPGGRPNVLQLGFRLPQPEPTAAVLDSVLDSFVDYMGLDEMVAPVESLQMKQHSIEEMLTKLLRKKAEIDAELTRRKARLLEKMRRSGAVSSLRPGDESPLSGDVQVVEGGRRPPPPPLPEPASTDAPEGPGESTPRELNVLRNPVGGEDGQLMQWQYELLEIKQLTSLYHIVQDMADLLETRKTKSKIARVEIISRPTVPTAPTSPKRLSHVLAGCTVLGGGIALGIVFVLFGLDDRLRSSGELHRLLAAPVLGTVNRHDEEIQTLRISLALCGPSPKVLAVAGVNDGDGGASIVVRLAAAFAAAGEKTLFVDADLRAAAERRTEQLSERGLTDLLAGDESVSEAFDHLITRAADPADICSRRLVAGHRPKVGPCGQVRNYEHAADAGCDVLPAGPSVQQVAPLLATGRFAELLALAGRRYDRVVIAAPAVSTCLDAAVIGRCTDGMLVVVRAGATRRRDVLTGLGRLRRFGCRIVGAVVNIPSRRANWDPADDWAAAAWPTVSAESPTGPPENADSPPIASISDRPRPVAVSHESPALRRDAA